MILLSYLCAGVFAGLIAGLLGVGGGIIVVPVLILAFEAQGFSDSILTHMAIATSLGTIVFTSLSSIWSHHKAGAVIWSVLLPIGAGICIGAVMGVLTVVQLDGQLLKMMIGVFAIFVAIKMLRHRTATESRLVPGNPVLAGAGVVIGWVSSMFGIGGGTLSVPFLSRTHMNMKHVIGTAAACGLPIAIIGTATNMWVGGDVSGRPEWSLGYVYLPALLGVVATSMVFARVGARLAHHVSSEKLKAIFAVMLIVVGLRFLFVA